MSSEAEQIKELLEDRSSEPYWGLDHVEVRKLIPRFEKAIAEERAAAVEEYKLTGGEDRR